MQVRQSATCSRSANAFVLFDVCKSANCSTQQERKRTRHPFFSLCAALGAFLEGSPSLGALREAFGLPGVPYPCISLALLIAFRAVQKGGGLRCMWRGSIAVGRNNSYPRLSPPISTMGRLLRVLAACGAKDMDCDVHSHSCAVSERCLEPEGAPLRFVPLLCRHHA